jgi:hypothetical protein
MTRYEVLAAAGDVGRLPGQLRFYKFFNPKGDVAEFYLDFCLRARPATQIYVLENLYQTVINLMPTPKERPGCYVMPGLIKKKRRKNEQEGQIL